MREEQLHASGAPVRVKYTDDSNNNSNNGKPKKASNTETQCDIYTDTNARCLFVYCVSGKTTLWMQVAVNQQTERKIHCEISSRIRVMCKHVHTVSWFPLQKLVFHSSVGCSCCFCCYFWLLLLLLCFGVRVSLCTVCVCVCVIDGIPFIRVIRLV